MPNPFSTYRLACAVLLAIATASSASAQSGVGQPCGGVAGPTCSVGLFCDVATGNCKDDDAEGICVVRQEMCTKMYKPICGCDGTTYGNDCERISAAARKARDGECPKP